MTGWVAPLVPLLIVAAIAVFALVLLVTRDIRTALPVLLDLLVAAGLLRLSAPEVSWRALVTAAALIAIRRLAGWGLTTARAAAAGT